MTDWELVAFGRPGKRKEWLRGLAGTSCANALGRPSPNGGQVRGSRGRQQSTRALPVRPTFSYAPENLIPSALPTAPPHHSAHQYLLWGMFDGPVGLGQ